MPAVVYSSVAINGDTPQIFTGSNRPAGSPSGTGNPVAGDPLQASAIVTIQAVASATADTAIALPLGARVLAVTALQNVAPTGATATMAIGTTVGGVDIVPAIDVKTAVQTVMPLALNAARPLLVANFASVVASSAGGSIINVRVTQGTPTAVGSWLLFIEYVMA